MFKQMEKAKIDTIRVIKNPFIVFFLITIIYHILIQPLVYDDIVNTNMLDQYTIPGYISFLYEEWTSRLVFSVTTAILLKYPIIWKLLDIVVFSTIPYLIAKLMDSSKTEEYFVCFMVLLYPFEDMKSAGWLTTTVNYLWPMWFALLACVIMRKYCLNKKIRWYEYLSGVVSILFASNLEQVAAILFILLCGVILYMYSQKKYRIWYVYFCFFINLLSLLFILTCPGNYNRASDLIVLNEFEGYERLALFDKVYLGFLNIMRVFVATPNRVFLVFSVGLFVIVCIKYSDLKKQVIAGMSIIVCFAYAIVGKAFPNLDVFFVPIEQNVTVDWFNIHTYIPVVYLLACAISIIYAIYIISINQKWTFVFSLLVLGAGLASAMIIALTASLYTSGARIFLFLYFAFIITLCMCYKQIDSEERQKINKQKLFLFGSICWCGISIIYNMCMCYVIGRIN